MDLPRKKLIHPGQCQLATRSAGRPLIKRVLAKPQQTQAHAFELVKCDELITKCQQLDCSVPKDLVHSRHQHAIYGPAASGSLAGAKGKTPARSTAARENYRCTGYIGSKGILGCSFNHLVVAGRSGIREDSNVLEPASLPNIHQDTSMKTLFLAALVVCSGSLCLAAEPLPRSSPESQGISSSAILAFIEAADKNIESMNSFMLVRHGQVVAEGWWSPYNAESPHSLYSLSKSFTSTAVGLAIAEGKLSVDDEVLKFFPEDAPPEPSKNLKAMRISDLLRMSTGHEAEPKRTPETAWTKTFLAQPVPHKPGTHFLYNTTAHVHAFRHRSKGDGHDGARLSETATCSSHWESSTRPGKPARKESRPAATG